MLWNWTRKATAAAAVLLAACGGGGGGGSSPLTVSVTEPEAVVASVSDAMVLEGASGTVDLVFTVTLNKASQSGNRVIWSTASTAKSGGGATGSATGGSSCGGGVDYISFPLTTLLIPRGDTTGVIRVPVCGDATFEPNETLSVVWNPAEGGTGGTVTGTIVNDDAGGLNGTGVATAFGRDSLALTNSGTDGLLGFSFANVTGTPAPCIRDNVTGLLWEGKTAGNAATTTTWAGTTALVTAANSGTGLCGFKDWRLPTPEELGSLVDSGLAGAPKTDTNWITLQQSAPYWTSTTRLDGVGQDAWMVDFATGIISVSNKSTAYGTRLVSRGGTTAPAPLPTSCTDGSRYTVHGDGTVTDARTGLMWKQCPEGLSGASCASGTAAALAWDAAVARPASTNADTSANLGFKDWRLPTRAELSSITEREQCLQNQASVVTSVFPNTGLVDYWTATPDASNALQAWRVNFSDGEVAPAVKTGLPSSTKRVRLVRAGQ